MTEECKKKTFYVKIFCYKSLTDAVTAVTCETLILITFFLQKVTSVFSVESLSIYNLESNFKPRKTFHEHPIIYACI